MKAIHQLNLTPRFSTLLREQPEPRHSPWELKQVTVGGGWHQLQPLHQPTKDLAHDFSGNQMFPSLLLKRKRQAGNELRSSNDGRQKIMAVFASSISIRLRRLCCHIVLQPGCGAGKQRQGWNLSLVEICAGSFNCTGFAREENFGTAVS